MYEQGHPNGIELLCVIVNFGLGSKVVHIAKEHGVTGGTIFLGKGTIRNRVLKFFSVTDIRKEVVLMIAEPEKVEHTVQHLNKELKMEKPNHGIAFTTSIMNVIGARPIHANSITEQKGAEHSMYEVITTIVDKGNAEYVIEAAAKVGSTGGTIINARGSGIHETSKLFSMEIEPEKEIVIILSEMNATEAIVASIRQDLHIDEPGKGIIFVQPVNRTYGLYKAK